MSSPSSLRKLSPRDKWVGRGGRKNIQRHFFGYLLHQLLISQHSLRKQMKVNRTLSPTLLSLDMVWPQKHRAYGESPFKHLVGTYTLSSSVCLLKPHGIPVHRNRIPSLFLTSHMHKIQNYNTGKCYKNYITGKERNSHAALFFKIYFYFI